MLSGSCHCERIKFALSTCLDPKDFIPRCCQCRFCRRHNATMVSDNQALLKLRTTGNPNDIYRFGLGTADFHVCSNCGVFVAATWNDDDSIFGVINIYALDDASHFGAASPMQFDDENVESRNARRRLNWTPTQINHSAA